MSEEFEAESTMTEAKNEEGVSEASAPSAPGQFDDSQSSVDTPTTTEADAGGLSGPSLASVIDVPLRITVEIGTAKMLVRDVLQLSKGSVVSLDRVSGDPADILVNGRLIARGEVTVLDESLAVRIVELVSPE